MHLEPMRVAAALGFGSEPEIEAWDKLMTWARATNHLDGTQRYFGFNNPAPMPGTPNYGYEQWMAVGADAQPLADVDIKEFEGGLYGVLRCEGLVTIEEDWARLADWLEHSDYRADPRPCLEELLSSPVLPHSEWVFDLHVAIAG